MPKLVDHRERRREIARATSGLIAEAGVGAVTFRTIADRLNYSTGIVQHYFGSKGELLLYTLRLEGARSQQRVESAFTDNPADLVALLSALLPLDDSRTRSWKTWLAYWGSAAQDPSIAMEQRRLFEAIRVMIAHSLRAHDADPSLRRDVEPARVASRLLALVHGIGMEAVCLPTDWPAERQIATVADEIRDLTGLDMSIHRDTQLELAHRDLKNNQ